MDPALAVLEFDSIAAGIAAGDAMIKRAPVAALRAGTVHPGRYVVLLGGLTADVEEAREAGLAVGGDALTDEVFLPDAHPDVVAAIGGARHEGGGEALGVIETRTVASAVLAADAGVKTAMVAIRELRLADELGGKAYVLFGGPVAEVEAAIEASSERIAHTGHEVRRTVIAQLHEGMGDELTADPRFLARARGAAKGG